MADEEAALANIEAVIAPGGRLVLIVPALPAIMGSVDEALGHHRRYTTAGLRALLTGRGYAIERLYHLNLIAYNETGGEFSRPAPGEVEALRARLERAGVSVTVRNSPGGDIEAACGQLALRHDRRG